MAEWLVPVVVGGIGVAITWATWITRRSFATLTRAEHDVICQRNQLTITEKLDEVLEGIKLADQRRDDIARKVGAMEGKVEVLKDRSDRAETESAGDRRRRIQRNTTDDHT